ncbi:MAG: hypothetical protein R8P61_28250 [Bacteroidia bacterium]|nr:hypothetical protein [Bacteroidia bacterium]
MKVKIIHATLGCEDSSCPTIYQNDLEDYLIQGFILDTKVKLALDIPEGEDAVVVPKGFMERYIANRIHMVCKTTYPTCEDTNFISPISQNSAGDYYVQGHILNSEDKVNLNIPEGEDAVVIQKESIEQYIALRITMALKRRTLELVTD